MEFLMSLMFLFFSLILMMNSEKSSNSMIFFVIMYTIFTSIIMSVNLSNSWIGISLYLMMVGGLMILFLIISSIIPKKISFSMKIFFIPTLFMIIIFMEMNEWKFIISTPYMILLYKIKMIFLIICILNMTLIMISKMMKMPLKPFRSNS